MRTATLPVSVVRVTGVPTNREVPVNVPVSVVNVGLGPVVLAVNTPVPAVKLTADPPGTELIVKSTAELTAEI